MKLTYSFKKILYFFKLLLIIIILIFSSNLKPTQAQFSNFGNPLIQNYLPTEYLASSQIWCVSQDRRGIMYFGNNPYLIEYDGNNWTKISMPGATPVRSIDFDKDGKLFIGSIGEFGYLAYNKLGESYYKSLVNLLSEEEKAFQNIWRTLCISSGVYFFGVDKIYYYDYEKITIIPAEMEAMFGFKAYDRIFVLLKNVGLSVIENSELIHLKGTEIFTTDYRMYNLLEYETDKLIIISRTNGLYTYDLSIFKENGIFNFSKNITEDYLLTKLNSDVTDYLTVNSLYSAVKFDENTYALGTVTGGVVLIDKNGNIIRIINENRGLNNNCIYSLFTDKKGNLWAGTQQGVSRIDLPTSINYYNESYNELNGYVISSVMVDETLYVGTMVGIYKSQDYIVNSTDDSYNFLKLNSETGEFWNFLTDKDYTLVTGSLGLFQILDNSLNRILDFRINYAVTSNFYEDIIYESSIKRVVCHRFHRFS